jgi:SET domain-containing protein
MSTADTHGFCVPYLVRTTANKGRGLFAGAFIPAGTTVWRHVAGQYAVYDERSLKALLCNMPNSEAVYVLTHIHCMPEFPEYMIRVLDDGELINHSDQPTLLTHTRPGYDQASAASSTEDVSTALLGDHFTLVAARDIEQGEELTLNYNDDPEGPQYYGTLCEHYGVTWDWL